MIQSYLSNDPRYRRVESVTGMISTIEQFVSELGPSSSDGKLVRVLVAIGDCEEEFSGLGPQLALILDLERPISRALESAGA